MLEIKDLTGGWGRTTVVEHLSLRLDQGECVAVVGRNGVGKTTLLELISGRAQQSSGTIAFAGTDISRMSAYSRARLGLGLVPQNREVFPSLTVREHLNVSARPGRWTQSSVLELLPRLGQRMDNLACHLSGGEQQMLAIARALLGNPRLILMDEPSEGLAPRVVEQLSDVLKAIIADGSLTMLLIEQRIDIAMELSTRYVIMDRGNIVHEGHSTDVLDGSVKLADLIGFEH
ncbi:ABC transporter ATP-binding protein [Pusillimonas noertemannii]|uniref:Branched-chain amino acid transport system ATP-binding protein n=1 Tax=Pusillimonas noertemannii TaxID=305977 RepID=A0A2U1CNX6_9BURK|nr:ABC transporter ATP-binding protein [Pusillimonas noertemannii]NYT68276.1 ABC transporter ATP-binding protein [Pusillimonas noertemannii]PVY62709.1 branched-chain amino acid transport system ATP-binding protein [Pusillimonas noertemannii]TFL10353.1 ABC transporter ATP-binding protein [Pusillimonas noertemannii]